MNKEEQEIIILRTGRKQIECNCQKCKNQCRTPCLGTPDDILRLIDAGYASKLILSHWMVGMMLRKIPCSIPMVQIMKGDNGCIFFKDGLCALHNTGLKPTEGKLSHHTITLENYIFELSLSWNVARTWIEDRNFLKVLKIFALMEYLK